MAEMSDEFLAPFQKTRGSGEYNHEAIMLKLDYICKNISEVKEDLKQLTKEHNTRKSECTACFAGSKEVDDKEEKIYLKINENYDELISKFRTRDTWLRALVIVGISSIISIFTLILTLIKLFH